MHSRSQKKHIQEILHGPPLPAQHYLPTAISSSIEPLRYQEALQQQGIETLSQILLVITPSSSTVPSVLVKEDFSHEVLWSNLKRLQQIRKRLEIGKKNMEKKNVKSSWWVRSTNFFLQQKGEDREKMDLFMFWICLGEKELRWHFQTFLGFLIWP